MFYYALHTGSTIEYPVHGVLAPDLVTEQLAVEAAAALNEKATELPPRLLELGTATAAFSRCVLDLASVQIDVKGIDTNPVATETAKRNLEGHERLGDLELITGDWHDPSTFSGGLFNCIYFNPPYLRPGSKLRPGFEQSPSEAVFSDDPDAEYRNMLPIIMRNLGIGGIAIVRYPGDGSLTFAGDDAKADHNPWVGFEEIDRTMERLVERGKWQKAHLPSDTRSFMWRGFLPGRRVNAEILTRIGGDIQNAPKIIRDMEAYWEAYS
jgi:methylase of polypeptide subunit release factors